MYDARGFPNNVAPRTLDRVQVDMGKGKVVREGCNRVAFEDRETGFPLDGRTNGSSFLSSFMESSKV